MQQQRRQQGLAPYELFAGVLSALQCFYVRQVHCCYWCVSCSCTVLQDNIKAVLRAGIVGLFGLAGVSGSEGSMISGKATAVLCLALSSTHLGRVPLQCTCNLRHISTVCCVRIALLSLVLAAGTCF
jgi:hypothetical protein